MREKVKLLEEKLYGFDIWDFFNFLYFHQLMVNDINFNNHFLLDPLIPFFFLLSLLFTFSTLYLNSSIPKGFSLASSDNSSSESSSPNEGGSIRNGPWVGATFGPTPKLNPSISSLSSCFCY